METEEKFEPQVIDVDLPWMPLYVVDFFADDRVEELDAKEQGYYLVLLARSWKLRGRGFEAVPKTLSKWGFKRASIPALVSTLIPTFFRQVNGRWYSPRLEVERQRQYELYEKRAKGGKAAAKARTANALRIATHNSELREDSSKTQNLQESPQTPLARSTNKTTRTLSAEAWSLWVARWNATAALVGCSQVSPKSTKLAEKARQRIHTYVAGSEFVGHTDVLTEICRELERSGRALSSQRWFSLPWLFERQGENLEKFLNGNYRDFGIERTQTDVKLANQFADIERELEQSHGAPADVLVEGGGSDHLGEVGRILAADGRDERGDAQRLPQGPRQISSP